MGTLPQKERREGGGEGDRQTDKEGRLVGTVLAQPFRKKWSLMLSSRQLGLGLRVQERLGVGPLSPGPPRGSGWHQFLGV